MYRVGGSNAHAAFAPAWLNAFEDQVEHVAAGEIRRLSCREWLKRCLFMDKGNGIKDLVRRRVAQLR